MPACRDRRSCKVMSGDRVISSDVMTVVEVPAMPVRPGAFLSPSEDEDVQVPGVEPDETRTPSLATPPTAKPPVTPGTVKPRPGGGPQP